jgi:hypothetical protein
MQKREHHVTAAIKSRDRSSTVEYLGPEEAHPDEIDPEARRVLFDTWTYPFKAAIDLEVEFPHWDRSQNNFSPKMIRRKFEFVPGPNGEPPAPVQIPRCYREAIRQTDGNGQIIGGLLQGAQLVGEENPPVLSADAARTTPGVALPFAPPPVFQTIAERAAPKSVEDLDARVMKRAKAAK